MVTTDNAFIDARLKYETYEISRECDTTKNEGESALHVLLHMDNPESEYIPY